MLDRFYFCSQSPALEDYMQVDCKDFLQYAGREHFFAGSVYGYRPDAIDSESRGTALCISTLESRDTGPYL